MPTDDADSGLALPKREFQIERILRLRAVGFDAREIARKLSDDPEIGKISSVTVARLMGEAAREARERHRELADKRFLEQDATLEYLRSKYMQLVESSPGYDDKLARALVSILERQAKLHGLDRGKANGGHGGNDWLEEATKDDLLRAAEAYGIRVPEKFRTEVVDA